MNKKYALGMFALLTVLVVGCTGDPTSSSTSTSSSGTSQSNTTTSTGNNDYLTNDDLERGKTTYVDDNGETQDLTINTLYTNANSPHLDPLKELHAMVVPFGFTDSDLQDVQSEANIERIRTVFFGDDEEIADVNGWISVADYYQTSSYGKSTFTGEVLPTWVVYNGTSSSFQRTYGTSLGVGAAEYARTWYINEYAKENHGSLGADAHDITWFDQNNDGYLDLVWVVYSHPTSQNDTNSWWAYVTYTGNNPNTSSPTVKTLGWASIDWMNNSYGGYDPHTFIHETGHTYGLNDYYDYTNTWKPMGGVDMMDQNLGDHSAYSKFELGWVNPWIVDEETLSQGKSVKVTLRPFTTTGDCFVIASPGYNGTAFDEYLMVELVAPIGDLNYQDYRGGYQSTTGYTKPGLRITHVDSRVYASGQHDSYLADNPEEGVDIRVNNTHGGRSGVGIDADYWEREDGSRFYFTQQSLMESTIAETNWTNSATYNATNSSLFTERNFFSLQEGAGWAEAFMPSGSNLWNKAKTITGWSGRNQTYEIDETCTMDMELYVESIVEDEEYGYLATVEIYLA